MVNLADQGKRPVVMGVRRTVVVDSGFCLLSGSTPSRRYFSWDSSGCEKAATSALFLHRQHDFAEVLAPFEITLGGAGLRQRKAFADHDLNFFSCTSLRISSNCLKSSGFALK